MKFRPWLLLTRPHGRIGVMLLVITWLFGIEFTFIFRPVNELEIVFTYLLLGLPLIAGGALAWTLQPALFATSTWGLPRFLCQMRRFHLSAAAAFSAVAAALAAFGFHDVSFLPLFAVALGVCLVVAPFEPGFTWAGSRLAAIVTAAAVITAIVSPGAIHTAVRDWPFPMGIAGFAVAAASAMFGFRAGAARRWLSHAPFVFLGQLRGDNRSGWTKPTLPPALAGRARWNESLVGAGPIALARAAHFHRAGSGPWRAHAVNSGIFLVLVLGFALFPWRGGTFLEALARNVFGSLDNNPISPVLFFVTALATGSNYPRPDWLYPLSRLRRAQATYVSFAQALGLAAALVGGTGVAIYWYARSRGTSVTPLELKWYLLGLLASTAFTPLAQWARLHMEVTRDKSVSATLWMGTIACSALYLAIAKLAFVPSAGVLLSTLAAVGLSQFIFYRNLRRFYTRGDLIQREGGKVKWGLV